MNDVPSKRVNLRLQFIKGDVCLFVFLVIDQDRNGTGKFLDALCVVGQCHDIAPKQKTKKGGAAGLDCRILSGRYTSEPAARYETNGIENSGGLMRQGHAVRTGDMIAARQESKNE